MLRPCLHNYLIYWSLPWCCTRAMKLVHLPGGELIKYKHLRHTYFKTHTDTKTWNTPSLDQGLLTMSWISEGQTQPVHIIMRVVPYVEKPPWTGCSRWILSSQRDRRQCFSRHLRKLNNLPDLINRHINSLKKTNRFSDNMFEEYPAKIRGGFD